MHRFGRKQLREYMRFATKLYDHARANVTEFSESDLVQCVLLTYLDLAPRVENHFVKWKEFLDYSLKFLSRQQKVWKWQTEKGMCHQLQHRSTEKVQSKKAYRYDLFSFVSSFYFKSSLLSCDFRWKLNLQRWVVRWVQIQSLIFFSEVCLLLSYR